VSALARKGLVLLLMLRAVGAPLALQPTLADDPDHSSVTLRRCAWPVSPPRLHFAAQVVQTGPGRPALAHLRLAAHSRGWLNEAYRFAKSPPGLPGGRTCRSSGRLRC
jgi:hypothetical protein